MDSKHQSAPDQHVHQVERSTRRVWGAAELKNAREMVQNDGNVALRLADPGKRVEDVRRLVEQHLDYLSPNTRSDRKRGPISIQ